MTRHVALAALWLAVVPGLAVAAAATKPLAEVPFTLHQNGIIVDAVVNGSEPVKLLLDTGWGPLALLSGSTGRLGLTVDAPDEEGIGRTRLRSLAVGGAVQNNPLVEVFQTESLAPLIGPHDGVLSTAFFRDLVLQVDYPAKVVRFWRRTPIPKSPRVTASRVTIPMVFSPRASGLPFTDSIYVDGKSVRGLFDTGGGGAFVAMPQFIERARLRAAPDSTKAFVGLMSGDTTARQAVEFTRFGRVAIGPFHADSARAMMAPPLLTGDNWGHDLNVGYGFMRHYVVTFDYPGKLITFERP